MLFIDEMKQNQNFELTNMWFAFGPFNYMSSSGRTVNSVWDKNVRNVSACGLGC